MDVFRGGISTMTTVIVITICSLCLTGCLFGKKKPDNGNDMDHPTPTQTVKPDTGAVTGTEGSDTQITDNFGRLMGVHYESSGGSMNYHSEFEIDVNENEIVFTSYYSNYYFDDLEYELGDEKLAEIDNTGRADSEENSRDEDLVVRRNVPADKELWNVLVEEFECLKPKLKEIPEYTKEDSHRSDEELQVLDGGDYSLLHLTWEKDGKTYTAQYQTPGGPRWGTIVNTLYEMIRPVGRDLRRIGPTRMKMMYLRTPDYSYQISPIDKEPGSYYFFIHDGKSASKKLNEDQWTVIRDHLAEMDLSGFDTGGYNDKRYLRLEYNDGDNFYYLIDKKTANELKEYILSLGY